MVELGASTAMTSWPRHHSGPTARTASGSSTILKYPLSGLSRMASSYRPDRPRPAKCRECICGIENDRGIWCATLKRIPTVRQVKRCRRFCPKAILEDACDAEV